MLLWPLTEHKMKIQTIVKNKSVRDRLQPVNPYQEGLALREAALQWRLNRVARIKGRARA